MRSFTSIVLAVLALAVWTNAACAEEVPLLDGHTMEGKVVAVTDKGLEIEGHIRSGGTYRMKLDADHLDPHWWYAKRDAALGSDAKARLELAVWAAEHGLFRQAKAQFEKARKLDADLAKKFKDQVLPGMREGIAADLVRSAGIAMNAGHLHAANKMLHAVLTRLGDTHAATQASDMLTSLHHRMDKKLAELAHWKKFGDDEKAREEADGRRAVTDPIVALIRQGHNIMLHMPTAAAQADAAEHTRQAAVEYKEALTKIDQAEKAHASDKKLMERLQSLKQEAQSGVVQSHITAGDVYNATGNYTDATAEANQLDALDYGAGEANALRGRIAESQAWADDGLVSTARWDSHRRVR